MDQEYSPVDGDSQNEYAPQNYYSQHGNSGSLHQEHPPIGQGSLFLQQPSFTPDRSINEPPFQHRIPLPHIPSFSSLHTSQQPSPYLPPHMYSYSTNTSPPAPEHTLSAPSVHPPPVSFSNLPYTPGHIGQYHFDSPPGPAPYVPFLHALYEPVARHAYTASTSSPAAASYVPHSPIGFFSYGNYLDPRISHPSPVHSAPVGLHPSNPPSLRSQSLFEASESGSGIEVKQQPRSRKVRRAASSLNITDIATQEVIDLSKRLYVVRCVTEGPPFPTQKQKEKIAKETSLLSRARFAKKTGKTQPPVPQDRGTLSSIYRTWETKRHALKNDCIARCVKGYNLDRKVTQGDGTERDPTPAEVANRVRNLIGPELNFICTQETDEKGHRLGFNGPFLHETLKRFIFVSNPDICRDFPERFNGIYVKGAVANVCTAMQCALDHFATGVLDGDGLHYTHRAYGAVFNKFYELFEGMETHPYHGPRLYAMLHDAFCKALQDTNSMAPPPDLPVLPDIQFGNLRHLIYDQVAINFFIDINGDPLSLVPAAASAGPDMNTEISTG